MRWQSVTDSVPAETEHVLLFDHVEGVTVGYYHEPYSFIQSVDGLRLKHVSHWMSIPDAPPIRIKDLAAYADQAPPTG